MNRFVNFGTYESLQADQLKNELEKSGIPVKVQYPGTEIGRESSGGANWPALTLLVPEIELDRANRIREKFSIKPVDFVRLPRSLFKWFNIALGIIAFFWLLLYISTYFRSNIEKFLEF